jgi:acetyl-CoA synthetase
MWFPDADAQKSNLASWISDRGLDDFPSFHQWSVQHRSEFWSDAVARLSIRFRQQPAQTVDLSQGPETPVWFPDAQLNIAESCFQSPREQAAIIFGGADGTRSQWTYGELQEKTWAVAKALRGAGFVPGDRLAVVLPMTADSVAIYLGIVWAGCAVVSIADSFAPKEIASRLRIADAKAVFTYDHVTRAGKQLPLYNRVVEATELPIITLPSGDSLSVTLRAQDRAWDNFLRAGEGSQATSAGTLPYIANPDDVINILFSSGTTGEPKAIPWTHTTPIKCAIDGYCHQDIRPEHVTCWPTNLGWMMGPFLIFATLINRGTIALYEDAPMGMGFGRFVEGAQVNMLGVIPTLVKNWRATGAMESCDWSSIHVFSSTGESSQPEDMLYLSSLAGMRPVIEYCGGTEIGGGYITSTVLSPNVPSAFSTPAVGLDLILLDESAQPTDAGEVFLIPPSIGLSTRLLNRDHHETYYGGTPQLESFPCLRRHGDHFRRLPGDIYVAGGRVDDTMNLGGIKVSSAELERVMNDVEGVHETAAIALTHCGGPEELFVFAVCRKVIPPADLVRLFNQKLREELNPLFKVSEVRVVESLPRTASNKVMRRTLRDQLLENKVSTS